MIDVTMTKPETECLREGAKAVGFEYAIRRKRDGGWLFSECTVPGPGDAWESDPSNATWVASLAKAMSMADLYGLAEDNGDPETDRVLDGYEIVRRPWFYEEDYINEEPMEAPMAGLDFSALGLTPSDFDHETHVLMAVDNGSI